MATVLAYLACFIAVLGVTSCAYENLFKGVYSGQKSERDLRRHLFQHYDKLVRPVKDGNEKITVEVNISPLRVQELDDKKQVLVMETFTLMKWKDDYLQWDPERYGNISNLRVPSTEVWRPDFAVYGSPDQSVMFPVPLTNVIIYNNGQVLWVPMFTIRSKCPILKVSKRMITCNIKIGSWTFSEELVDIQLAADKADISNFEDIHPDWKLMDVVSNRIAKYYPCCKEAYPNLNFNVTLKRRRDVDRSVNEENTTMKLQDLVLSDLSDIENLFG